MKKFLSKNRRGKNQLVEAFSPEAAEEFLGPDYATYRQALTDSSAYAEYGVGSSTIFVDRNFTCRIKAVETDELWAQRTSELTPRQDIIHVDLGPVGKFGRPTSYRHSDKFREYFEGPFSDGFEPDVVLIDGRFRVACFFTALKLSSPGTTIFFDDYPYRERYHVVEEVITPEQVGRRLARFVRPDHVDAELLTKKIDQFSFVMD